EVGGVMYDVIIVRFRTNKDVSPDVVVDASANVHKEMRAVGAGRASRRVIAAAIRFVEKHSLCADAGHQVSRGLLREVRGIDGVHVIDQRAKLLIVVVEGVPVSKGNIR